MSIPTCAPVFIWCANRAGGSSAPRMTVGIMQPYFLPYIGYWQLLAAVDRFVIYDNIQYTKKGWINRNRFLRDGRDVYFTVPLKKASDYLNVVERQLADDFDRDQLLRTWSAAYRRAPHVGDVMPVLERIVRAPIGNLFEYVQHSIAEMARSEERRVGKECRFRGSEDT